MHSHRLDRSFFARHAVTVAEDLLGKVLCWRGQTGIITETEAYRGEDDPACHAFRGKTPRNAIIFGAPGYSYVYFIYGMYFCFNIVTEPESVPSAVLIRGLLVPPTHANGPGKLCRLLGITKTDDAMDLVTSEACFVAEHPQKIIFPYEVTPRIGIRLAQEKPWRFVIAPHVDLSSIIT